MKIGWGWLGRLILGVISLTISVLASYCCSVVIRGDQTNNYQKIKQISCICQPAVCVTAVRFQSVWKRFDYMFSPVYKQVGIFIQ